jgi:hypothetical protein
MVVTDLETQEEVEVGELRAAISPKNISKDKLPSRAQVEKELEKNYHKALAAQTKKFGFDEPPAMFLGGFGNKILDHVRNLVCKNVTGEMEPDDVVTMIIEALTTIIPGGFLMKPVVKLVTKFILGQGIVAFCSVSQDKKEN